MFQNHGFHTGPIEENNNKLSRTSDISYWNFVLSKPKVTINIRGQHVLVCVTAGVLEPFGWVGKPF